MYIAPDTIIKILHNCPLDETYQHTIYFESATDQTAYFSGLAKYTLNNQTFQRVQRGRMRVERKADDLYDCNYLMFQNSAFGNKWFYAFITAVEYVNNITSEIAFELDPMQTWAFDYTLGESFVEREHAETDDVGDNLAAENVATGEYVITDEGGTNLLSDYSIVAGCTIDDTATDFYGAMYSGIFSGLYFRSFPNNAAGAADAAAFLEAASVKEGSVITLFLMPSCMVQPAGSSIPQGYTFGKPKRTTGDIDGYTPRNNKLYTYPYNFLYVTNQQGNAGVFPYEYFSTESCNFYLTGDMSPSPTQVLSPQQYKGLSDNYDEKMVLSGWPQLSWSSDAFKAWLGNTAQANMTQGVATAGSVAAGAAISGSANVGALAAVSGIGSVIGILTQGAQLYNMPPQARGSAGPSTMAAIGRLDFAFYNKHVRAEYAKIIDDYFTMFGYATRRVKVPNRNVRPHWTYTKTIGCVAHGSVPAADMRRICEIYDRGITFWKDGAEIGDYSLDNSPQ